MLDPSHLRRSIAFILLAPALVVWASACASKSSGGGGGGGPGGGSNVACPKTLAAACAAGEAPGEFGVSCAQTWDAALADKHYCGGTVTEVEEDCGSYQARIVINVDVSNTYYYDKTTGALVAVIGTGYDNSSQCVGGPTTFVVPTCGASQPLDPCVADAGTEGG